tara:strand:+ start:131 stop:286 length:156 start_codon:yes stop_codon:yes gene_type:complete
LQAKTLEKEKKTAKYFTPLVGGELPRPLTPRKRVKEKEKRNVGSSVGCSAT